ncbi:MAG: heme-binding protein [Rhodospirillaceae bacterium]|nr:heme-binding protein [Rhodospirillaceae bacterium]
MTEPKLYDLKTDMSLVVADKIIDSALAAGIAADMLPLTVVVLDAGGHTVALKRQDGSGILRVDIATGKAWGALGMGIPSRTIRDRLGQRPAFQGALAAASDGRFVPVPGGVLVLNGDSHVIGAVGISGDTSEKDEYCAIHGIKAAGFAPAPGEPDEAWKDSGL